MGGRGSSSGISKGNKEISVREGMTPAQVDSAHTQIANQAREAARRRDQQILDVQNKAVSGAISPADAIQKLQTINDEYDRTMNPLKKANEKLSKLYGVFQTL